MKEILKENFALISVILLPVILGTVFYISVSYQKSQFVPPNYKLVFASSYNHHQDRPYQLVIKNQKLYVSYTPKEKNNYYRIPNLYVFDAENGSSEKIKLPPVKDKENGFDVIVKDLENERIIEKEESPDGYKVERTYHNRGLMNEIFSGGYRSRDRHILTKDSNYLSIEKSNHYNIEVIGWIAKDKE